MLLSTLALLNTFNSEVTTGAQMSDEASALTWSGGQSCL